MRPRDGEKGGGGDRRFVRESELNEGAAGLETDRGDPGVLS